MIFIFFLVKNPKNGWIGWKEPLAIDY